MVEFQAELATQATTIAAAVATACVAGAGVGLTIWGIKKVYRGFRGM